MPVRLFTVIFPQVVDLGILCSFSLPVFCNSPLCRFGVKTFNYFERNKAPGYMGVWELFSQSASFLTHFLKSIPTRSPFRKAQGSDSHWEVF